MKARELKCTWHRGVICMQHGTLHVAQLLVPGAAGYDGETVVPVGSFCTISALYSWCEAQGAMDSQRNAMGAKRRPRPAHPDKRPLVATRQPRRSLDPRSS